MVFLFGRLKAGLLFLLSLVRRSLCCLRRRRKFSADDDSVQLTHIGVIPSQEGVISSGHQHQQPHYPRGETGSWSDWEEPRQQPNTVEQYIQEYRSKTKESLVSEPPPDYFQDMEPRIKRQTKVLLKPASSGDSPAAVSSRLAFNLESPLVVGPRDSGELETWEESEAGGGGTGAGGGGGGGHWAEEAQAWDATEEILRAARREEQRKRLQEQREHRKTLVAKLS